MKTQEELKHYQKLTKFQKEIVDAIEKNGYKHKYFNTYFKIGCLDLDVSKINNLSELLITIHSHGKTHKLWEIQNLLGIQANF